MTCQLAEAFAQDAAGAGADVRPRRVAELKVLFSNEPWFLVEGPAYGALGSLGPGAGRARRWWTMSARAAIAAPFLPGIAAVLGFTGKAIIL